VLAPDGFYDALTTRGFTFFTGVPDSLLKDLCAYVTDQVDEQHHVIAANEGGAAALAAGHFVATGAPGVVYMQNSGQGNAVNPLVSLADPDVFGIPMLLLVGWRGEPGREDEPQHVKQGKITGALFDAMGIEWALLPEDIDGAGRALDAALAHMKAKAAPYALIIREGTFGGYKLQKAVKTSYDLNREQALKVVADALDPSAIVVSTTGKTARELFEHRQTTGRTQDADFRTVGCMGHASQIALGIALSTSGRPVVCLDGDGAAIMHLGAMALIGTRAPSTFMHVVFNNGAHDSVGGQPTAGFQIDLPAIAGACGYREVATVSTASGIRDALAHLAATPGPTFLEIKVNKGARADLGRPTISPQTNKRALMAVLSAHHA
jgi:phosphonopyruvate decarboxylase